MIALLCALALQQASGPSFVKVDEPAATEIAFAAALPLPKLGANDMQLLEVAVAALRDGSEVYTSRTIKNVTDGRGVSCELTPDAVMVSFVVPKGSFSYGVAMLASFLKEPSFRQESLDKAVAFLTSKPPTYWSQAMHPLPFDLKTPTHDDVFNLFERVCRPERLTVACVGPVEKENLSDAWLSKSSNWPVEDDPQFPDETAIKPPTEGVQGVTTAALKGPEFKATDPAIPEKLLALYALGSGKGSSLFRVSREQHGWSYQQASYLWPTLSGFVPALFVAMRPNPEATKRMSDLQQELTADVAAWTEDDRTRSVGMAEATLLRGVPFGPILLGDHPLDQGMQDQACINAYWRMKTTTPWNPSQLLEAMKTTDLTALKAAAQDILSGGTFQVLEGR